MNPPMIWAQSRNFVFLTVKLPDLANEEIGFLPSAVHVEAYKGNQQYTANIELFGEIAYKDGETKYSKLGSGIQMTLRKRDTTIWWTRLTKSQTKLQYLSVDWEKWVEDPNADEPLKDGEIDITNTPDDEFTDPSSDNEEDQKNSKE